MISGIYKDMKICIHTNDFELDESNHQLILRKFKLALTRIEPFIKTITMHLSTASDVNPCNDIHCKLNVCLCDKPSFIVEDIQKDLDFVVDRVIQKASRSINRKLVGDM